MLRHTTSAAAVVVGVIIFTLMAATPARAACEPEASATASNERSIEDGGTDNGAERCVFHLAAGATEIEWERPSVALADALTPARLTLPEGAADVEGAVQVWTRPEGTRAWWAWHRVYPSVPGAAAVPPVASADPAAGGTATAPMLERGQRYWFITQYDIAWTAPVDAASVFEEAQIVSLYGYPGIPFMGALGKYSPEDAAIETIRLAQEYEAAGDGTPVLPALHLIVSVAQPRPGEDGDYLYRMPAELLDEYVQVTQEMGLLLFIDVQIGWADALEETRHYEEILALPHVHYAVDPEFATRPKDAVPGAAIGYVTGTEINVLQEYLAEVVARYALPPKVFVVHQFRDDMIRDAESIAAVDSVDLVIDMDGWGPPGSKASGYDLYALAPYSEYAGFKLFYEWDVPLFTVEQVQSLPQGRPHYVIYQ